MDKRIINKVKSIINQNGGFREKDIIKNCTYEKSETWNDIHKIVDVISIEADLSCAVDIVTNKICG